MSADLEHSAALYRSDDFRNLVRAAITEHAYKIGPGDTLAGKLAASVLNDPESMLRAFIPLAANDADISASETLDNEAIRRVVRDTWDLVAGAVPSLGS